MPIYPYSFTLPPVNKQDIPSDGVAGEFLGINSGGQLDWLPVSASGSGDMLKADNLSGLTSYPTARTNLGLGTGDSPTFANLTLTSPSLVSSAPVTISQTWNNAAVAFTGFKFNAAGTSGTNSAAASLLLDLQVGGVSQFNVRKSGQAFFSSGIVSAPGITFLSGSNTGIWETSAGVHFSSAGTNAFGIRNEIRVNSSLAFGFASGTPADTGLDVALWRDAANTLALRNGAGVPQAFRVYNTFLGTTANEWFEIDWKTTAGLLRLATTSGGTGVARSMEIIASGQISLTTGSGHPIDFRPAGVTRWTIHTPGNLWATTDNAYDIGASGASRPRNVYVGTSLFTGAGGINFDINARLRSPATDVITLYNNGLSDFGRLQFGGTADTHPAIARDGAGIKFTGAAAGSTAWIKVPPVAVGSLPVAATAGAGARAFVNDASAPVFGTAVSGGGAVTVPVYCTGSAWNVG